MFDVIEQGRTDDIIGKMRVSALLESLPGVGKVRARQLMEKIGISESRRVRGLGANQVAALHREFADLPGAGLPGPGLPGTGQPGASPQR